MFLVQPVLEYLSLDCTVLYDKVELFDTFRSKGKQEGINGKLVPQNCLLFCCIVLYHGHKWVTTMVSQ